MWSWAQLPDGTILLMFTYNNVEYPLLTIADEGEFERFCENTIKFREKLSVPEVFKDAFDK